MRTHDAGIEDVFLDPDRLAKLASAFPAIDAAVARAREDLALPGLAVGVVIDGQLAHAAVAGLRDVAAGAPVTADTVFRIGSVTKTVTAAAILKLRDDGKLSLDEPAATYLPELAGVRYPSADAPFITLRHLLAHRSGLPRDRKGTAAERAALLDGMVLEFTPGERESYSNFGFSVLGLVVERVANEPYAAYVQKAFFTPLGMTSAAWAPDRIARDALAISYRSGKDGAFEPMSHEPLAGGDPSGGLYLSLRDLGRWIGWQMSAYPPRSDAAAGPLARATLRESHGVVGDLSVGVGAPFSTLEPWIAEPWAAGTALGWGASAMCDFDRLVEKNGLVEGFQTESGFFPAEGIGIVVLANKGRVDGLKRRAFFDVLKLLRGTGGVARRVRIARRTPELDGALARLLEVMNDWDDGKYRAMLTAQHQERVPLEREKRELAGYAALHGRCSGGTVVRFDSAAHARYRLECERGRLEMDLSIADGLINGFVGHSKEVEADPAMRDAALAALAMLARNGRRRTKVVDVLLSAAELDRRADSYLRSHGSCELGALAELDGNGWARFELACKRGHGVVLAIRLDDATSSKIAGLELEPTGGRCARVLGAHADPSPRGAGRPATAAAASKPR
jgi:CubicO group peptidase (beta-lactamase class C family)